MRCLNCGQDGLPLKTEICPSCGVLIASAHRDALPNGTVIEERYHIDYPLGQGGFGITYRAFDLVQERHVALKEFFPQEYAQRDRRTGGFVVPNNGQEEFRKNLNRFLKEGLILAKIDCPNVVRVYDLLQVRDTAYLVMELVHGQSLRAELDASPQRCLPPERVAEIAAVLVEALATVHQKGIYHLDLAPDNVLIDTDDRVVLVDFGAARQGSTRTRTYQPFKEAYAPQEVLASGEVGPESDIYELGVMLAEMLTGSRPQSVLERLYSDRWTPESVAEPWRELLSAALELRQEDRPRDIRHWWTASFPAGATPTTVSPVPPTPRRSSPQSPRTPVRKGRSPLRRIANATVAALRRDMRIAYGLMYAIGGASLIASTTSARMVDGTSLLASTAFGRIVFNALALKIPVLSLALTGALFVGLGFAASKRSREAANVAIGLYGLSLAINLHWILVRFPEIRASFRAALLKSAVTDSFIRAAIVVFLLRGLFALQKWHRIGRAERLAILREWRRESGADDPDADDFGLGQLRQFLTPYWQEAKPTIDRILAWDAIDAKQIKAGKPLPKRHLIEAQRVIYAIGAAKICYGLFMGNTSVYASIEVGAILWGGMYLFLGRRTGRFSEIALAAGLTAYSLEILQMVALGVLRPGFLRNYPGFIWGFGIYFLLKIGLVTLIARGFLALRTWKRENLAPAAIPSR